MDWMDIFLIFQDGKVSNILDFGIGKGVPNLFLHEGLATPLTSIIFSLGMQINK